MEFTGERFHPACTGSIAVEHYHRYLFALSFVQGKSVLDIASGEGYGTALLARSAAHVVGVDVSAEAVAHARNRYPADNITFLQADAAGLPLPDADLDVVVSFETLEHLHAQEAMLDELRRVLRPEGLLIISTPNKAVYGSGENRFHVRELDENEFLGLLTARFAHVRLLGQKAMYGSLLEGDSGRIRLYGPDAPEQPSDTSRFTEQAMYFIALASNAPLAATDTSFLQYPLDKTDPVSVLKNEATILHKRLQATEEYTDILQQQINSKDNELIILHRELSDIKSTLIYMENSRSWRFTYPLRFVVRHVKNILC